MYAFAVTRHDRFAGLSLTEKPVPKPAPKEVSIDVHAAGLGLIDAFWVTGAMPTQPGFVPGLEVAGTVREIGAEVTGLTAGDKVAAILPGAGGFAEIACTPAKLVAHVPAGLSLDVAAVVPINTVTAHLGLTTVARLAPGEALLVHAGVGGLGSQFGQVARALGAARVDAVVGSAEKQETARRLGYDHAYLRGDLTSIPAETYDIVIDPVGGEATESAFRTLRSGGRLVRVGNASQAPDVRLSSIAHWLENKTTTGFNVGAWLAGNPGHGTESLRWALDAVAGGDVRVELTATGGPDQLTEMLAALERGETTGKLALRLENAGVVH